MNNILIITIIISSPILIYFISFKFSYFSLLFLLPLLLFLFKNIYFFIPISIIFLFSILLILLVKEKIISKEKEMKYKKMIEDIDKEEKEINNLKKEILNLTEKEKKINILYSIIKILSEKNNLNTLYSSLKEKFSSYISDNDISFFILFENEIFKIFGSYETKDLNELFNQNNNREILNLRDKKVFLLKKEDLNFILIVNSKVEDFVLKDLKDLTSQIYPALKRIFLFNKIDKLSLIDGLTGIFRRGVFDERIEEEFKRANAFKTQLGIMILDIDHFKKINDTYGHQSGDEVLKKIANILKNSVYETDFIARYGGEEFVILMPRAQNEGAFRKAESIRKKIEEEVFDLGLQKIKVTISIGLAFYPKNAKTSKELIEKADKALYIAKETGRNKVKEYNN